MGIREPILLARGLQTHLRLKNERQYIEGAFAIIEKVVAELPALTNGIKLPTPDQLPMAQKIVVGRSLSGSKQSVTQPGDEATAQTSAAATTVITSPNETDDELPQRNDGQSHSKNVASPKNVAFPITLTEDMLHPLVANVTCAPKLDVRQYCITFFYDGLFILAGIAPPKELWLGVQYATYAQQINCEMELFAMKTWWRLLFNAGYRIENWPCPGQIPAKLDEPAFKTPVQHWPVVMRHAIVKQYCNPNMDQRLRIVCREQDQERIPFITFALGADGERLAQPADYPGDIVNTRPHNCKCFKHNGIDVAPRYLAKADTPVPRVTPATGTIPVPKTKSRKAPVVVGAKGKKRASPAQLQSETVSTSRQGSAPPTATIARSTRAGMKRKHTTGDNGLTAITEEEDAGLVGKTAENIDNGDTSLTNNQEKPPSKKARVVEQVAETSFGGRFKVAPRAIPKGGKSNASQSTVTPPSVPQPVLAAPQQP
ncbi:hypothetical protein M422DRAFT_277208, partial [Sphaerobolus stellatus SS14]